MAPILIGFLIGFAMLVTHAVAYGSGANHGYQLAIAEANVALMKYQIGLAQSQQEQKPEKPQDLGVN